MGFPKVIPVWLETEPECMCLSEYGMWHKMIDERLRQIHEPVVITHNEAIITEIIFEQQQYELKLSGAEWDCYFNLSSEEKLELEKWDELKKIPTGVFEKWIKKTNKRIGTNYERRIVRKGVYGFQRWGSLGLFDSENLTMLNRFLTLCSSKTNSVQRKDLTYLERDTKN